MNIEQATVLVVDDEENVQKLLSQILTEAGFNVITANDAVDALNKIDLQEIKVLLLDLKMPGISGIDMLRRLSEKHDWNEYCAIMVTAVSDMETAVQTMKLGAADYITKPFHGEEVLATLREAIKKRDVNLRERQHYQKMSEKFSDHSQRMQGQFNELVDSLAREHKLMIELAKRQSGGGQDLLAKLPAELREPIPTIEEFRNALLRILKSA